MVGKRVICCIIAALLAFCLLFPESTQGHAASSSEIQEEIDELEQQKEALLEQLEELESKLSDNVSEIEAIYAQKQTIDRQVSLLGQSIATTDAQILAYASAIADRQEELDAAQERLNELNAAYRERIRTMEEDGKLSYLSVLLQADSFFDFLDRLEMIEEVASADKRRLQELEAAAEAVAAAQTVLAVEKSKQEDIRAEQEIAVQLLNDKLSQSTALLQQLVERNEEYQQLLHAGEEAQNELMQEIAQKQDEFDQAAYEEWLASQQPVTPPDGYQWLTPLTSYRLTSPFGMRLHPILGIYRMHSGIDMAAPRMTPIYASRGGQVTIADKNDSAGLYVQINHGDGYKSVYMHMEYYIVKVGEYVAQGQVIGYVGTSGMSNGYHLHFGISYNGAYVNPCNYVALY